MPTSKPVSRLLGRMREKDEARLRIQAQRESFESSLLGQLPLEILIQLLYTVLGYTASGRYLFTALISAYPHLNNMLLLVTDVEHGQSLEIISLEGVRRVTMEYYLKSMSSKERANFPMKLLVYRRCDKFQTTLLNMTSMCYYSLPMARDTAVVFSTDTNSPINRQIMEHHCRRAGVPVAVYVPSLCPDPTIVSMENNPERDMSIMSFSTKLPYVTHSIDMVSFNKGVAIQGVFPYNLKHFKVQISDCVHDGPPKSKTLCPTPMVFFQAPDLQTLSIIYSSHWTPLVALGLPGTFVNTTPYAISHLSIINTNWSNDNPYGKACKHSKRHLGQAFMSVHPKQLALPARPSFRNICLIGVSTQFVHYLYWPSVGFLYWKRLCPLRSNVLRSQLEERRTTQALIRASAMTRTTIFSVVTNEEIELDPVPAFDAPHLQRVTLVAVERSDGVWDLRKLLPARNNVKNLAMANMSTSDAILDLGYENISPVVSTVEIMSLIGYRPTFLDKQVSLNTEPFLKLVELTLDVCSLYDRVSYKRIGDQYSPARKCAWWTVFKTQKMKRKAHAHKLKSSPAKHHVNAVSILLTKQMFPCIKFLNLKALQKNLGLLGQGGVVIDLEVPNTMVTISLSSLIRAKYVRINGKIGGLYDHSTVTGRENTVWILGKSWFSGRAASHGFSPSSILSKAEDKMTLEETLERYST